MMGMRLREGVDLSRIAVRCKVDEDTLIDTRQAMALEGHGLIRQEGSRLTVTDKGTPLLDLILSELVAI